MQVPSYHTSVYVCNHITLLFPFLPDITFPGTRSHYPQLPASFFDQSYLVCA
jgi:hypothetical protein